MSRDFFLRYYSENSLIILLFEIIFLIFHFFSSLSFPLRLI